MPAIPLKEAMIVWTPDSDLWRQNRRASPAGSIALVHWPEHKSAWTRFPKSDGACAADWQNGSDEYRMDRLARLVRQLLEQEGIPQEHVSQVLRGIEIPDPDYFSEALRRQAERRGLEEEEEDEEEPGHG
jgi:hypothetical protein